MRSPFESLTSRELDVLRLIARGYGNKQIAAALGIAEITVKAHRRHIMEKLHLRSVPDLVRAAGATGAGSHVMLEWDLRSSAP